MSLRVLWCYYILHSVPSIKVLIFLPSGKRKKRINKCDILLHPTVRLSKEAKQKEGIKYSMQREKHTKW